VEPERFEELDHTADWALRVQGRDLSELCLHAATAMLAVSGARPATGNGERHEVALRAPDAESLLVRWLEEILYALEVRRTLPTRITLTVSPDLALRATWDEAPLESIEKPIKAVTYHGLEVRRLADQLEATIVFDV